ncbi:hypothetical protein AB0J86_14250 [Micromonospora sp. NPDC049559]|uniref:hypothetical protein n=1 Tax=Micromonospora sp. NPDC049559 TaxID=3155923 RepID=UPI0034380B0A
MLDAYAAIGLGEVAPQAVIAHEYGHLIQAAGNLFGSDLPGPEASRRLEMMADRFPRISWATPEARR